MPFRLNLQTAPAHVSPAGWFWSGRVALGTGLSRAPTASGVDN